MNEDIIELYKIDEELDNSEYKTNDYITAFEKIYEKFEGYFGIKTEMEEWGLDENGKEIKHTLKEYKKFYDKLIKNIYSMLIKKEYKRIIKMESLQ